MKQDNARQGTATLSKPEAVWKAIEALGSRAEVSEILEYVRTKFGITAESEPPEVGASAPVAVQPPPSLPVSDVPLQPIQKQPETQASDQARKPGGQKKPRSRHDSE